MKNPFKKEQPPLQENPDLTKIKGLSDARRMPRLEKIRLGAKVEKNNGTAAKPKMVEYPIELPFFLLPEEVAAVHGGKIENIEERAKKLNVTRADVLKFVSENSHRLAEELPVMLPMDDTRHTFPQAYKMYGGSIGLKCKGNGEQAEQRVGITNEFKPVRCPCNNLKTDENEKGACNRVANLQVILPEVSMGGVYQIDMSSVNSIIDINSGIAYTKSIYMKATGKPQAAMVPLMLSRSPTETHHGGKKQWHWTCRLTPVGNIQTFSQLAESSKMLITHAEAMGGLMLPEPDTSDPTLDAVDMSYIQPEHIKQILDELERMKSVGKLTKGEIEQVRLAVGQQDDDEIEKIYKYVLERVPKGKSADDVTAAVSNQTAPLDDHQVPPDQGDPSPV